MYARIEHPGTVAVLVEVAGQIDDRLGSPRSIHVAGWASDIAREVLPKDNMVILASCLEDFGSGGHRVKEGPLRNVLINALRPQLEKIVRTALQDLVDRGLT